MKHVITYNVALFTKRNQSGIIIIIVVIQNCKTRQKKQNHGNQE